MDVAIDAARTIAHRFAAGAEVSSVEPLAGGHIHASFVVALRGDGPAGGRRLLLQRINERVFPQP